MVCYVQDRVEDILNIYMHIDKDDSGHVCYDELTPLRPVFSKYVPLVEIEKHGDLKLDTFFHLFHIATLRQRKICQ